MSWYLKRLWCFITNIVPTLRFSFWYARNSRHSCGLLRDIFEHQYCNWLDLCTAWSLHRRALWYAERERKRLAAYRARVRVRVIEEKEQVDSLGGEQNDNARSL